jgi:ATP-dependent Clp protease ATP-binding subunit ClpC
MSLPRSRELSSIFGQAQDIADKSGRELTSAHLLLALFTVPNRAAVFLEDRNITVDSLLEVLERLPDEPDELLDRVTQRSGRIAVGSQADAINSLHLLAALVRENRSHAYTLLDETGANVSAIRASVMSYATGSRTIPRRFRSQVSVSAPAVAREVGGTVPPTSKPKAAVADGPREHAPSNLGFHPSLGIGRRLFPNAGVDDSSDELLGLAASTRPTGPDTAEFTRRPDDAKVSEQPERRTIRRKPARPELRAASDRVTADERPADRDAAPPAPGAPANGASTPAPEDDAVAEARRTARRLAESLFRKKKEAAEAARAKARNQDDRSNDDTDAHEVATAEALRENEQPILVAPELPDIEVDIAPARGTEPPPTPRVGNRRLAEAYKLDPDQYPNLVKFGRNLTEEAALGRIDRVIGRDREILQLVDILGKRRSNNPILVGEAGVGKTAIVEGLANSFCEMAQAGHRLGQRAIIEIEVGHILGGTHLRGSFSERLAKIKDEVRRAEGDVIVFLDEIHAWMNAGAGGDGTDAAGELKTALARGEFPCIGATTADEFTRFVEADPAFERRFDVVFVDEPDLDTSVTILKGIREHYEDHHGVRFNDDALDAAVRLSYRYIHERRLPDKAIGVLDLTGSRAARRGVETVGRIEVSRVVAELADVPVERLTQSDSERLLDMESVIGKKLVGHTDVVNAVSEVIRRNHAGFRSDRPIGSLLFLGPTGVGKTELVKVLADFLFHDRDAVCRFDMSEFGEAHTVARLIGAPPGYVGHEAGGQLTEAIRRRPYQIVLFDEVEKAHPDVWNIFLQLLDEGQLTDGRGRKVDFKNCVIVMTSNLGADVFDTGSTTTRGRIGFGGETTRERDEGLRDAVRDAARETFPPELWNRIDERLVFMPLVRSEVARIAGLQLAGTSSRLRDECGISLVFSDFVVPFLVDNGGFDPRYGARPMRKTIERLVESGVARLILAGEATRGDTVYVDVRDAELVLQVAD